MSLPRGAALADAVVWHDVECAAYDADLPLWRELAEAAGGPVLDLGCGTGRVALDLAARGHEVTALDVDPALVRELAARARERGLRVRTEVADARSFSLGREFALAIAPMQVVQLLGGESGALRLLACVREHLRPGGVVAAAIADPLEGVPAGEAEPLVPDVREQDGWVFSSTPLAVRGEPGATLIDRLRQSVSPGGDLDESVVTIRLDDLPPDRLEHLGASLRLRTLPRRHVPPSGDYVGSAVAMLERLP
ncbi:MAG TPA: class I SAM-dependent methyltransferase [Thermoleophilaceae bacterium]